MQELLSRVDIVDIVGRHVALKKGGANLMGLCPFHAEKSPSFSVSPAKQFYHCFGCGVSGDAIRFLTEYSGMSFVDAVRDLAQQTGLAVPEDDVSPAEREQAAAHKQRRATLSETLARAADAYRKQLRQSPRAIDYLKGRGLSGEIAAQFGLGYAPDGWRNLASVFPSYDDPLLEESGLVIAKDAEDAGAASGPSAGPPWATQGPTSWTSAGPHPLGGSADVPGGRGAPSRRYDRFRDRIMFPIRSVQGDVIGFGGRVLDRGEPKYLNSPETPVFSKGRELYGLFEGRAALRQRGYALVVEGYMDVVALAQSGFGNAVATLGTACTPEHLHKLFRFTDSVVFSFDGDKAGRRAAARALEAALPHASDTRTIRFLFLPAEHDPDSYVREFGPAGFEICVAQAVPLSRQLIEQAGDGCDLGTAEGRAHLLANARPLWSALPDGTLKRQLLAELAAAARDDVDQLLRQWGQPPALSSAPRPGAPARRPPTRRAGALSKGMAGLLDRAVWLLLQRSDLWPALDGESHDLLAQQAAPYDLLFGCIERQLLEHGTLSPGALLEALRFEAAELPAGATTVERIARLHLSDPDVDFARELELVLDGVRLRAVRDELDLIAEAGLVSPDSQQRFKQLNAELARLKSHLAKQQSTVD
ncbi:MAG TPA: DNA primase [Burkholderiaceae bacterium]|nr:DNA primase [Burkholderiaceae bacterium]